MNTHRMLQFLILALLLVGFEHRSATADFTPIRFEARQVATAPVIDGDLSDPAWGQAELMDEFYAYRSGGDPPAAATTARILWDETYLYVGFEMTDADIRSSCDLRGVCGRDANLFQGDVIELFVKESTSNTRYHEFEWSPLGEEFDARFDRVRFGSPGTGWESGMSSAVQVQGTADDPSDTDTGWTIEARIPLADFELSSVECRNGMDVHRRSVRLLQPAATIARRIDDAHPRRPRRPTGRRHLGFSHLRDLRHPRVYGDPRAVNGNACCRVGSVGDGWCCASLYTQEVRTGLAQK